MNFEQSVKLPDQVSTTEDGIKICSREQSLKASLPIDVIVEGIANLSKFSIFSKHQFFFDSTIKNKQLQFDYCLQLLVKRSYMIFCC